MITTESSKTNALRLARLLVKNKLAACVSIKEIFSIYEWDNDIEENKEFEITIKSKPELKKTLMDCLQKMTSYDIPQIIYKKFNSEKKYINWVYKSISN